MNAFKQSRTTCLTRTTRLERTTRLICGSFLVLAAGTSFAKKVDYVDLTKNDGIHMDHGRVEVSVVNGEYAQVSSGPTVPFYLRMKAACKNGDVVKSATVSYGQENVSEDALEYSNNYKVSLGNQAMGQTMPYTLAKMLVPLNKLGIDPVAVCRNMLQQKMTQGVAKHQIMNSEQSRVSLVPFTAVASCGKWHKENKQKYAKDTYADQLTVICKSGASHPGGTSLKAPKGPITAVPLGGNGQIQLGANPLMISQGEIIAGGMKNYAGTCPAQLPMAVKLKGSGKGKVRVHVVEGSDKIWESVPLDYDGTQGWKQLNFFYNLPAQASYMDVKKNRSFRLFVELKDQNADSFIWSAKGDLDTYAWSHTCQSAPVVTMGGQGTIQMKPEASKPLDKQSLDSQPMKIEAVILPSSKPEESKARFQGKEGSR